MRSIRVFLIVVSLSLICLVNFLSAVNGFRSSMEEAERLIHRQLIDTAQLLEGVRYTSIETKIVESKALETGTVETFASQMQDGWFQIWESETLMVKSPLAPSDSTGLKAPGMHRVSFDGSGWMTLVYPVASTRNNKIIVVAQRAGVYRKMMESMVLESILPIVWVLPLLGIFIWLTVRLGMNPLKHLANQLRTRQADDFTSLHVDGYPEELKEVVLSTNTLLGRLSEAFEREKRFTADAAHELRTPLSSMKIHLHNLSNNSKGGVDEINALLESADRMGHSIEQLLSLYRMFSDDSNSLNNPVRMDVLIRQTVADLYPLIEKKHQQVSVDAAPAIVLGEEFALQVMLKNILDNACKYTPDGGRICISLQPKSCSGISGWEVIVEDSGEGIPEDSYQRVFDRFYRLGGDRHQSKTMGSGLGLSIVENIVRLHKGSVSLQQSETLGGLKVMIWLQESSVGPSGSGSDD